jgi:hypothetical protein
MFSGNTPILLIHKNATIIFYFKKTYDKERIAAH